jgi:hypothetical protein
MNNNFWDGKGCDRCRTDAVGGTAIALKKLAVNGLLYLYQCSFCTAFWEENPREMHPIDESKAAADFPKYKSES